MADDNDWVLDHSGIGVADIVVSARFYGAVLGTLNVREVMRIGRDMKPASAASDNLGGVAYGVNFPAFWLDVFHPSGVRQHTAFRARSRAQVEAFHAAALTHGGKDNGAPGLREGAYPPGYYAAFVIDPDGNNIEAVYREPQ